MLNESGWRDDEGNPADPMEDLSTKAEVALGKVVKDKFGADYYILGKCDSSISTCIIGSEICR
jgi:ergosteryl-3beta-O-L-aspartate synthase